MKSREAARPAIREGWIAVRLFKNYVSNLGVVGKWESFDGVVSFIGDELSLLEAVPTEQALVLRKQKPVKHTHVVSRTQGVELMGGEVTWPLNGEKVVEGGGFISLK